MPSRTHPIPATSEPAELTAAATRKPPILVPVLFLVTGLIAILFRPAFTHAASATSHSPLPEEGRLLSRMRADGTNAALLFRLADVCHSAGGKGGDKEAALRAEGYLRQLLQLLPSNAPALALLGSVYTIKGRDAFWPTAQLRLVKEGNAIMDRAIQLEPDNVQARLIRAFNNAHMPDFLGRTEIVRADLAWLWEKAEKEPARFTVADRQETALHWGRQLKRQERTGDARNVWERGRTLDPQSPLAKMLGEELGKLR